MQFRPDAPLAQHYLSEFGGMRWIQELTKFTRVELLLGMSPFLCLEKGPPDRSYNQLVATTKVLWGEH